MNGCDHCQSFRRRGAGDVMGAPATQPDRYREAQTALVSTCVYLSLNGLEGSSALLFLSELQKLLGDCIYAPPELVPLREAVAVMLRQKDVRGRDVAFLRVKLELRTYYSHAAAHRVSAWQESAGGV